MSGELASVNKRQELQAGPQGQLGGDGPFTTTQLTRLDEALTLSSRETGLIFSVYVGDFRTPTRAHAEALFERLDDRAVLVAVSPGQRALHIVTGPASAKRLPNRSCALAALAMRGGVRQR